MDAEMIYQQVCHVCHATGAGGAPLMTAQDWGGRLDKSQSELIQSVIDGLGAMPPRAGRPDLTDEQIEVTVAYMLEQL
jgi:cytochrome c5